MIHLTASPLARHEPVVACLALLALSASAAMAGPDWDEVAHGDAGSLPSSAQHVTGLGVLSSIHGTLGEAADAPDFQDMYLIRIDCPTAITFKAGTDPSFGGTADFNTQLWLFDASGLGLLGNNDVTPSLGLSGLGNMSTDGTSIVVGAPGFYYIAISGAGSNPLGSSGLPIFSFGSPLEVSGPDGTGGSSPIADWTEPGAVGEYLIKFSACAQFVPEPSCQADLDGNGVVDGADLGLLLGDWGPGPGPADLSGDGKVDGADLGRMLGAWGPCGT